MRKAALASALTLLLTLSATPALLTGAIPVTPGASSHDTGLGYAPTATDFIYPVGNPRIAPTYDNANGNGYMITQMFNNSCDPSLGQGYYFAGHYFCGHTGVDLSNLQMSGVVHAIANGVVVFSGYSSTYGEMVRIQHVLSDGSYIYSQYEHLEYGSRLVFYGQVVTIGEPIGLVGNTGFVTGPHLHLEIKSTNEDGVGYTFGNTALILGYYDAISWIANHTQQLLPTATPTLVPASPTPVASSDAASSTVAVTATVPATNSTSTSSSSIASNGGEQQSLLADFYSSYHSYVVVTADHLNVRAGSGYDYSAMNSVTRGARLGYLGLTGNGWVHVALPSSIFGYVAREWVKGKILPKLPPIQISVKLKAPFVTVLDTRYPARGGPLMRDEAIEPLKVGEKLSYLGTLGSWDKVGLPTGRIGWVLNWYLRQPGVQWNLAPARATATVQPVAAGHAGAMVKSKAAMTIAGPYVVTTVDGLRLREGPRLSASVIEGLARGTKLGLRGYHTSWVAVQAPDGRQGYVLGTFVNVLGTAGTTQTSDSAADASAVPPVAAAVTSTIPLTASANTAPPVSDGPGPRTIHDAAGFQAPYLIVTVPMTTGANLRASPSLKAAILRSEPRDTVLAWRGTQGAWAYVETRKGLIGWIMRNLTAPTADRGSR